MKSIKISKENEVFNQYTINNKTPPIIINLTKLNIFVGANNSGKSRFLREIFKFLTNAYSITDKKAVIDLDLSLKINPKKIYDEIINDDLSLDHFKLTRNDLKKLLLNKAKTWKDFEEKMHDCIGYDEPNIPEDHEHEASVKKLIEYCFGKQTNQIKDKYQLTYIPILRSLRKINKEDYKNRTFNDYFSEYKEVSKDEKLVKLNIFTGEDLFSEIKNLLLSNYEDRQILIEFEEFISYYFFEGKQVSLIPREKKDDKSVNEDLYIKIGKEKERSIYDLGDGIQTIIIFTFPLFKYKHKKHILFIDEPEQNLHPGMQRVLIEILEDERMQNTQIFFTTHSNHLLDLSLENKKRTSIYSFKKDGINEQIEDSTQTAKFKIVNQSFNIDLLNSLGVRNSSVSLANCTIWVEGITDRKYIKQFLKIYLANNKKATKYLENLHYSFVEYAGSNIVHWNFDNNSDDDTIFAEKISNHIFLIADSDIKLLDEKNEKDKVKIDKVKIDKNDIDSKQFFKFNDNIFEISKYELHEKLKTELGDKQFFRLDCKEIENTLTPTVIKEIVASYEKKKPEILKFKVNIDKTEKGLSLNNDKDKPIYWWQNIGEFIDNNLENKTRTTYKDGNTVKDKIAFCDKAINFLEENKKDWINNYDKYLSEETKSLCSKIVDFIEESNQ